MWAQREENQVSRLHYQHWWNWSWPWEDLCCRKLAITKDSERNTIVSKILQLLPPLHLWLQEDCEASSQSHQDECSLLLQLSLYRSLSRTQEQAHFCLSPLTLQYEPPYNGEDWRLRRGCCRNPLSAALWHGMILSSLLLKDYGPCRVQLRDSW